MTIQTTEITREFLYKGITLPDPDPALTPRQVAQRYAHQHPELLTAEPLPARVGEGRQVIEFKENFGTKG